MGNPTLRGAVAGRTRSRPRRGPARPPTGPAAPRRRPRAAGGSASRRRCCSPTRPRPSGASTRSTSVGKQEAVDQDDGVGHAVAERECARHRRARGGRRPPAAEAQHLDRQLLGGQHARAQRSPARRVGADARSRARAARHRLVAPTPRSSASATTASRSGAGARVPLGRQAVEVGATPRAGFVVPRLARRSPAARRVMTRIGWVAAAEPGRLCAPGSRSPAAR